MTLDVLVFTPVYRLEPETVAAVLALEWDGPISWLFQRDNPHRGDDATAVGVQNHLHQYQRGREVFLSGPYDAMLVIESDIIPPPDALRRLAALDCDLAYGAYVYRNSRVVNIYERYPQPAANVGESLSLHPGKWLAALAAGVVDCSGGGLGCVLIRRPVLERLAFRTLSPAMRPKVHCDTWFTVDAYSAGYTMRADTRVQCGHKTEDGEVLWPSK